MQRVLIAGCGYVGQALASRLQSSAIATYRLRRTPPPHPPTETWIAGDLTALTPEDLPPGIDTLVYLASPGARSEEAYRRVYVQGLQQTLQSLASRSPSSLRRAILVTSTAVHGQQEGQWVHETTPPSPPDPYAEQLLQGEHLLHKHRSIIPTLEHTTAVRFGGIYGPGRTRLIRRTAVEHTAATPCRWTNRIHRDDCARALLHILHLEQPAETYIGVDREPAPLHKVQTWIASQLPPMEHTAAVNTAPQRGRRTQGTPRTNKRCSSQRLQDTGFQFQYPTYREGYKELIAQQWPPGGSPAKPHEK